jgi:hypothetical protein
VPPDDVAAPLHQGFVIRPWSAGAGRTIVRTLALSATAARIRTHTGNLRV